MATNPHHLSKSADWGTPVPTIEMVRRILGSIEVDACSSGYWNHHTVKARLFYDEAIDCRTQRPSCLTMLVNSPGDPTGGLVKSIWEWCSQAWYRGEVDSMVWIGFSLEQVSYLQLAPLHPLQFPTLFPSRRLRFLKRGARGGPPVLGDAPTHSNFITLLPSRGVRSIAEGQLRRMRAEAKRLDIVDHPWGAMTMPLAA